MRRILIILSFIFLPVSAFADSFTINMTRGVTPMSHDIYDLHMTIFWICVAIGVVVFGAMIYAMVRHRKSIGHKPAKFHGSTGVELTWTLIPFLILVAMAVPATLVLIRMEDDAKADVNIKVTGYQWKWQYEYLDYGISYFSNLSTPRAQIEGKEKKGQWYLLEVDKPLVVPIHKKIRFLVTSNDVIHSWWVPALGVKRDAIPGFIHESWARIEKPGVYRGQCAELCGMDHAYMPIVVVAKTESDFNRWVAEQTNPKTPTKTAALKTMTKEALMKEGETVYNSKCAVCHKSDGTGTPPAFPALKGSKIATGSVNDHIAIVLNGKSGTSMQAFKDQMSVEEIAAVVTYERNSWGNDGGVVQPADVAKLKQGSQ